MFAAREPIERGCANRSNEVAQTLCRVKLREPIERGCADVILRSCANRSNSVAQTLSYERTTRNDGTDRESSGEILWRNVDPRFSALSLLFQIVFPLYSGRRGLDRASIAMRSCAAARKRDDPLRSGDCGAAGGGGVETKRRRVPREFIAYYVSNEESGRYDSCGREKEGRGEQAEGRKGKEGPRKESVRAVGGVVRKSSVVS